MENKTKKPLGTKKLLIAACAVLLALVVLFALLGRSAKPETVQGEKTFTLTVVHGDGESVPMELNTNAETLGDALTELGVIQGEEGEYGLYVNTVDGETADTAQEQWWCLTKGGEMWMEGVDATPVLDGDAFEFTLTTGYDWQ